HDACLHAGWRVLVEASLKTGCPLWLKQIVEDAHLRLVVGPPLDLLGTDGRELAVGGRAVAGAVELGTYPQLLPFQGSGPFRALPSRAQLLLNGAFDQIRLALVARRGAGGGLHVAETN